MYIPSCNPKITRNCSISPLACGASTRNIGISGAASTFTSDETKRAILQGLGVHAETAESLRESIEARRRKEWTRAGAARAWW